MEYRSIYQFINQYNIKYTQNYMIHKRKVMERGGGRDEGRDEERDEERDDEI